MTITNTISFEASRVTTKTELDIQDDNFIYCTRLINSKLFKFLIDQELPISVKYIANLSKLNDEMFIVLAESQIIEFED